MRDQQTFQAITVEQDFIVACKQFREEVSHSSIPVWVGNRRDLRETIDVSNGLYGSIADPQRADVGVLLIKLPKEITDALILLWRKNGSPWMKLLCSQRLPACLLWASTKIYIGNSYVDF